MKLNNLFLQNFRAYPEQKFEFSPGFNLIVGANGMGKSTLLEAIFLLSNGYSPITRKEKELIRWGEDEFVLRCEISLSEDKVQAHSLLYQNSGEKTVQINGERSHKMSDLMGKVPSVILLPDDILLVNEGPSYRRRFLDGLLCQISSNYLSDLRDYGRILKQRNTALKESFKYSPEILEVLSGQLCETGARILKERYNFGLRFSPHVEEVFKKVTEQADIKFEIEYESFLDNLNENESTIRQEFWHKLKENAEYERLLKTTTIGPHRDNLLLLLKGRKASDFGSQGQRRLIAISLKLASSEVLKGEFGYPPILLLDDVFSELDEGKRNRLSHIIGHEHQVIMASPRQKDIPFEVEKIIELNAEGQVK